MLSYTRQKKGAGRKLTRPDCITGKERGNEGTLGEAAFLRKAPPPDPLPESTWGIHAMRRSVRLDVPPVRLRLASWPCAKIHRRTGAFFSANARLLPESACCFQAIRCSARLALRENPSPHRRVLFGNCSPPPGKRMLHSSSPRLSASPTMQSPHNSPPSPKSTAKKRFPFGEGGAGGRTLSFF